ncbi:MAG: hypothetical protein ACRYFS_12350 [Janthinobacterium lividum]
MDWTWGPFLRLRPSLDVPMQPWVWVRLFTALSLAGLVLLGSMGLVCVLGPRIAARQHWTVPAPLVETLGTLAAMENDPGLRVMLIGLGLSLPLLFFTACFPFHAAWNRRAARLAQDKSRLGGQAAQTDVWPPAPNNR